MVILLIIVDYKNINLCSSRYSTKGERHYLRVWGIFKRRIAQVSYNE
ncbi:MAG: hypothetical protein WBA22_03775 [Candidatus Methanofastidiosia archaeon]